MITKLILILAVIWLFCIVAGFLISYLHDKNDSALEGIKYYQLSTMGHIAKLAAPVNYLLIAIGCLGLGMLPTLLIFQGIYAPGIFGVIIMACSVFFGYHSVVAIMLYLQYAKHERGRTISFNTDNKLIIFKNEREGSDKPLAEEDVEIVEIYQSSGNRRKPTAEFEYVKFIDKSGHEFIITSLQTNVLNLADFFDTRKLKFVNNKVNWIK